MSKQTTSKTNYLTRIAAMAVVAALLMAACASSDDSDAPAAAAADTTMAVTTTVAPIAGGEAGAPADEANLGSGGVGQPVQTPITAGRDIIFTAELTVSVDNVADASTRAVAIIGSLDGFLFGQRTVAEPAPTSILTFKVPPARFQEALAALGEVGEIRNQFVSADDVTDRLVDLASRITTAATSVERLRTLLENAEAIETITTLENQLLERETVLEQLRGSRRTLQNQVSLATITVSITEAEARPQIDVQLTAYLGYDDLGTSCPGDPGIVVVEGETITYCVEIVNTGDTSLRDIDVRDVVIGKELDNFVVVFGDMDAVLEPGQSIVLATDLDMERNLRTQTRVTATPINADGSVLEGRTAANTSTITLGARDPGGIPTFREGLERSSEVLVNLILLIVLVFGALIPFIWVIPLAWLLLRWQRSRAVQRAAEREAARERGRRLAQDRAPAPVAAAPESPSGSDDGWDLEDDV